MSKPLQVQVTCHNGDTYIDGFHGDWELAQWYYKKFPHVNTSNVEGVYRFTTIVKVELIQEEAAVELKAAA